MLDEEQRHLRSHFHVPVFDSVRGDSTARGLLSRARLSWLFQGPRRDCRQGMCERAVSGTPVRNNEPLSLSFRKPLTPRLTWRELSCQGRLPNLKTDWNSG